MIFAHVGFASHGHEHFEVDYSKNLEQVYIDFALFFVSLKGWSALLDEVGDPKAQVRKALPSWLPDWSSSYLSPPRFPKQYAKLEPTPWSNQFRYLERKIFNIKYFDVRDLVGPEIRVDKFSEASCHNLASNFADISFSRRDTLFHVGQDSPNMRAEHHCVKSGPCLPIVRICIFCHLSHTGSLKTMSMHAAMTIKSVEYSGARYFYFLY